MARRAPATLTPKAARCRRKFLRFFPEGYRDETYVDWERGYKWQAHERWQAELGAAAFGAHLKAGDHEGIARRAVTIESRTNLLFSFEKMALRDAVKMPGGARTFAEGLHAFLHGQGSQQARFEAWVEAVSRLPRRQTRVLTWPLVTVFGFIANAYVSRPNWATYESLLAFAAQVRRDTRDLGPRDMIDLQGFIWVQGSDEY
jgi:hypothetical protein